MTDIVIAIPTFKRPQSLKRLLDAIANLQTRAQICVLVADNDAQDHAGFDVSSNLAPSYRFALKTVIAPQRGIAQVRNVLIAHALEMRADFIAMIDDDEWPEPQWIEQFLRVAQNTGAGVLQGSILFDHPAQADIARPTGAVPMLQGAGNLLLRRSVLETMPRPWFDPEFALSGGEDREFFVRLARAGVAFAWADEARCRGEVAQSRAGLSWMLQRAYSIGNSDMRVLLKHHLGPGAFCTEIAKIAAALLLSAPAALILAASPNRRAIPLEKLFRAAGKLSAMLGSRYNEYHVIHGD
jgi:succinoglycan biosynthesis protein ExoM